MSRHSDFITIARNANRKVWEGINELKSLQTEWNALDYGNTLTDGVNGNAGITKAQVGAVVFDSANDLLDVLATGVATNMARLL
jgi:hypothetical protein